MCRFCCYGCLFRSIQFLIASSLLILANYQSYAKEKYLLLCDSELLNLSRKILINQVGITEKTNRNDGDVVKYLKAVGLNEGQPYCAAAQYWCFEQARKLLADEVKNPLPKTGLANNFFNFAKKVGIKTQYIPNIDDLIIWQKSNSPFGHTERIISTGKAGWVYTIAFNVKIYNNPKQGVYKVKRNIYYPLYRMNIRGLVGFIKEQ